MFASQCCGESINSLAEALAQGVVGVRVIGCRAEVRCRCGGGWRDQAQMMSRQRGRTLVARYAVQHGRQQDAYPEE
ncbi:hypothetical protein BKG78_22650 [Mycobacteroides chelonae]|nr:hypothetical protein BKG78_22650 [Mycobacteroides chelonae]